MTIIIVDKLFFDFLTIVIVILIIWRKIALFKRCQRHQIFIDWKICIQLYDSDGVEFFLWFISFYQHWNPLDFLFLEPVLFWMN